LSLPRLSIAGRNRLLEQSRQRHQASCPRAHRPPTPSERKAARFIFLSRSLMSLSFISDSSEKNETQRHCDCLLCRQTQSHSGIAPAYVHRQDWSSSLSHFL
jgi:hypothetical protein